MLTDALDLLRGPEAAVVIQSLRERYRFVLIDEFQDTDHVQWEIFRTAFIDPVDGAVATSPPVVIVGDPKQSIYRFRSAELQAYLAAVEHAGDGIASLGTNWRSDRPLIEALDDLFSGFEFGRPDVAFSPVQASDRHQVARIRSRRTPAVPVTPLQIRAMA
ncbi:UvrD-helicase domain-containing protein, partial [Arthrospira platensis SPKY2]